VHYVINPATVAKFMIEAGRPGHSPPRAMSGNHLAAELLDSAFGQQSVGRYWRNKTYRLRGREFIATMHHHAPADDGAEHHVVQVGYLGLNFFARTAEALGAT
jgi:hypothetical protein